MMRASNGAGLARNRHNTARQIPVMYATRLMTEIYHRVLPGGQHTLCGLRISRITSERKTTTLQLVNQLEPNLVICKHCERISNHGESDEIAS